ncbi:thiamine biosynthesis protein ThiC [Streptomyces zagrosensis]|uniref:Thiamine biosynthesis protein ThiC n=1 Tax=Streptomyces zagrosensis TaxID=1042984 RepID=A0A7W9Q8B8_9ACTN|nr:phosphomethylpyrimidine synthase ThiC [Streptomyces zagrosensis]MBB5935376.1 thiamine biosynthesis protein ThiC [Streptomyces zagrosensis]
MTAPWGRAGPGTPTEAATRAAAPFSTLGPLTTDVAPAYDHSTSPQAAAAHRP